MPENQTPQRDQDVVAYESFTGLRNEVTPERFTQGDLEVANNVDLDKTGRLSRRDGYTQIKPGATRSLWADPQGELCFYAAGGWLCQLGTDYTGTPLVELRDPGSPISFQRVNDRVYFTNGTDRGVYEFGAVRSWGLPVPPLPQVALVVGAMPAGSYQFVVTHLRAGGQESGAQALAGVIEAPEQSGLAFTLPPITDPGVVAQAVHLSTANGTTLYLAGIVDARNNRFRYTDDPSQNHLPLATAGMQQPPLGQLVSFYRGRMYVAQGDVLYVSQPFGYELFDLRDYVQLDGRITMLAPLYEKEYYERGTSSGFFIGTDRTCGVLVGGSPDQFQYVPKTTYGAIPGTMCMVDGSLFGDNSQGARDLPVWLSQEGVCVGMSDLSIRNLTRSKFQFSAAGQGAATFLAGPNRFIASSNL